VHKIQAPLGRDMPDDADDAITGQRIYGCELIQQMGILLRMPQVAVSTAQVMFHRFYAKRSFYKFDARVRQCPEDSPA
jgi:hypothetical protein